MSRLAEKMEPPRAWTSGTIDPPSNWVVTLSDELVSAYSKDETEALDGSTGLIDAWRPDLEHALSSLNVGRGFVLIDRIPIESLTADEARRVYWRVGQSLGQLIEQNIEGTLLYDVRDTGQTVGEGARFSVTNAESSFHTDAAFADEPPEFVGLLNLHSAVSGGRSQLVSAYSMHNTLADEAQGALDVLYENFSFDRRGQFRPGEPELMVAPVFRWDEAELNTRYLHYYITEGHGAGDSLTGAQIAALDKVLDIVSRPELRVEFSLKPGQMLFTNNHWILHNRTAFEDDPHPDKRRHYIRLWLKRAA